MKLNCRNCTHYQEAKSGSFDRYCQFLGRWITREQVESGCDNWKFLDIEEKRVLERSW